MPRFLSPISKAFNNRKLFSMNKTIGKTSFQDMGDIWRNSSKL